MFVANHGGGYSFTQANSGKSWTLLFDTNIYDWSGHTITCFQMVVPGIVPSKVKIWQDASSAMAIVWIVAHRNALVWDGNKVNTEWTYGLYHAPVSPWYCGGQPGYDPYTPPSPPVPLTLNKPGVALAFWAPLGITGAPTLTPGLTLDGWVYGSVSGASGGAVAAERSFVAPGNTGQMWASNSVQQYCSAAIPVYEAEGTPPQTDDRFTMDWKHGTQIDGATIPYRHFTASAYHAARKKHVICGGNNEAWTPTVYGDTWEADLTAQTLVQHAATSPGTRYAHTMCYDSQRAKVMLWGNWSSDSSLWEYDTSWVSRSQAGSPPTGRSAAKYGARMCYDPVYNKALFFGGVTYGTSTDSNETWEINFNANPVVWTKITPATSPAGRRFHAMCYNPKDELIYMTGGCSGSNPISMYGDTWTYNMATHQWSQVSCVVNMAVRAQHGMYYDAAHDWVVCVGGYLSIGVYGGGTIATQVCQILTADHSWFPLELSTSAAGRDGHFWVGSHGLSFDEDRQTALISLGDKCDDSNNGLWWNHIAECYFVRPEIKYVGYYARAIYDPSPTSFPFDFRSVPGQAGDWIYMGGFFMKNGYDIGPLNLINGAGYEEICAVNHEVPNYNWKFRMWRGLWGNVSLTPIVNFPNGGYIRGAYAGSVYRNASSTILHSAWAWGTGNYREGIRITDGWPLPYQKNALLGALWAGPEAWGENGYNSRVLVPYGWSRPGVTGFGYYSMSVALGDKYVAWSPTNTHSGPYTMWANQITYGIGYGFMLQAAATAQRDSTVAFNTKDPLLVIAQDVVRFAFDGELAVDNPYLDISSYKIEGVGHSDECWIKSVLPVLGRTTSYLYISLGGIGYDRSYKFTVLDRQVHDRYGANILECSISWTHHRTKVDSAIQGLPGGLDLRERSNVRGLIEAMMISDEIIGGDF